MHKFKNILLILFIFLFCASKGNCDTVWVNNLREQFLSDNAIIYAINIRTFNAKDINRNEIIDEDLGEERGSFLSAIERLDELRANGVNTILLMPVTSVGRVKALGTAGSLYAPSSFCDINPQLKSLHSNSSAYSEMNKFVEECHKRGLSVIVDLPSCASYDLYLLHPEFFIKDKNQNPIIPADWTDVRLLDAGTETQINQDVYNLYSNFIKMMLDLNVDGIRANVATIKPYSFWKNIIQDTRTRNPQFLFLAQASESSKETSQCPIFTPCQKLLEAGFDGYYGTYDNIYNWKSANDLYNTVKSDISTAKKYEHKKAVIGNFATHDQISPILAKGPQLSKMIIWLSSTLPINSYYVDGFSTGDTYLYAWANKKASISYTDDDYYFAHRGQFDIFNFSRQPGGNSADVARNFLMANRFKFLAKNILNNGNFNILKTSSPEVFAFSRCTEKETIIVYGNLDFSKGNEAVIILPKSIENMMSFPVKITTIPVVLKNKLTVNLVPGEIGVIYFGANPNPQKKPKHRFLITTTTEVTAGSVMSEEISKSSVKNKLKRIKSKKFHKISK